MSTLPIGIDDSAMNNQVIIIILITNLLLPGPLLLSLNWSSLL
jgi:hypothetical protein